jgi:ABC-2 type transport system ATP-binding protein
LCDRVAIVDHGRVIALGTPNQLKRRYSADTITVTPDVTASALPALARELADATSAKASVTENGAIRLTVTDPTPAMAAVFGVLAVSRVNVLAASVGQPSLDDVFLRETGRSLRDAGAPDSGRATGADAAQEVAA